MQMSRVRRGMKEVVLQIPQVLQILHIVLPQHYHRIYLENLYQILLPQKAGTLRI
jgi:hypothetical protein